MLLYVVVFIVLFLFLLFYFLVFYCFIITLCLPFVANKRVHNHGPRFIRTQAKPAYINFESGGDAVPLSVRKS